MNYQISVSPKYQVTIPKDIRNKIKSLKPFSKVQMTYDDENNQIIIKPVDSIEKTKGALGKPIRYGNLDPKELQLRIEEEKIKYYAKKYGSNS